MNHQSQGLGQSPKSAETVPQFCDGHNISRTHFYELIKQGRAPRLMKVGRRTLISAEAAFDWRRRIEAETAADGSASTSAQPVTA
jgi:predicted DNA-binding transcriptional regulator AlpA